MTLSRDCRPISPRDSPNDRHDAGRGPGEKPRSRNRPRLALLDLPIMKEHGQHVQVEVTRLRRFEDFATDVKKRLE
jgi:hypothetical protein